MTARTDNTEPTLRILSLGAGVQSTTLLMLSAEGVLPKLDAAIFADTGWEPRSVYEHLDRLEEEIARPAGIPIYRVNNGNLRDDVLNPNKMRNIPAFTASEPYQVTVVDEWALCPDASCGWRQLRQIKIEAEDSLFDVTVEDTSDMAGLFDSVITVPERATLERLDAMTREAERYRAEHDEDDDDPISSQQVAKALRRAGLDRLPVPHESCRSMGLVAVREHTEWRRDFGKQRRGCTQQYKLRPVHERVRLLLGATVGEEKPCTYCEGRGERVAPWRAKRGEDVVADCSVCDGLGMLSRVGQPPAGVWAEQWIGFSTDEIGRVSNRGDTHYSRSRHPLLELDMSREQCDAYLKANGWTSVAKSACIGCPFHGNAEWRRMRDTDPTSWADAVEFDQAYRRGLGMRHERFLHISCRPLDQAPIDKVRPGEWQKGSVLDAVYDIQLAEQGAPDSCSPWGCRSGEPVLPEIEDHDERLAS